MKFKLIDNNNNTFNFSVEKVLELLLKNLNDKKNEPKSDNTELTVKLAKYLQSTDSLLSYRLIDIMSICFDLGFYYARFLDKNKVEIIKD